MQGARKMHEIPVKMRTEWRVNSVHDYLGIRRIAFIASIELYCPHLQSTLPHGDGE